MNRPGFVQRVDYSRPALRDRTCLRLILQRVELGLKRRRRNGFLVSRILNAVWSLRIRTHLFEELRDSLPTWPSESSKFVCSGGGRKVLINTSAILCRCLSKIAVLYDVEYESSLGREHKHFLDTDKRDLNQHNWLHNTVSEMFGQDEARGDARAGLYEVESGRSCSHL